VKPVGIEQTKIRNCQPKETAQEIIIILTFDNRQLSPELVGLLLEDV
jgi:hypothetical protein